MTNANMDLPREVLQHIFTLRGEKSSAEPLLTLKDRVRCLAVCRSWRDHLSPASWPLERLRICWPNYASLVAPPAEWTLRTHPAARSVSVQSLPLWQFEHLAPLRSYLSQAHSELRELHFLLDPGIVCSLWPAVCALPGITSLGLKWIHGGAGAAVLDSRMLAGLPSGLERLFVQGWGRVEMRGPEQLLPALTQLTVAAGDGRAVVRVDAPLPRLRELLADGVDEVVLAGANLALPQLTLLVASAGDHAFEEDALCALSADFRRMPLLASLGMEVMALAEPSASSFASLARLTRLVLNPTGELDEGGASLVRQAPPTLRSLHIGYYQLDGMAAIADFAAALCRLTGLSSLTGMNVAIFLPFLAPLTGLRELEVQWFDDSRGYGIDTMRRPPVDRILGGVTKFISMGGTLARHLPLLGQLQELCVHSPDAAGLSLGELGWLASLPGLRRVSLLESPGDMDMSTSEQEEEQARCLKALRAALPGCEVVVADTFEYFLEL